MTALKHITHSSQNNIIMGRSAGHLPRFPVPFWLSHILVYLFILLLSQLMPKLGQK